LLAYAKDTNRLLYQSSAADHDGIKDAGRAKKAKAPVRTTYHIPALDGYAIPKRGDLLQSNLGKRTERTWFILTVREVDSRVCPEMGGIMTRRFKVWAERWWHLEPETRMRLFQSAERAGGQNVHLFHRFPPKRSKITFEQYMGAR
jgi:hypothetical protein